MKNNSQRRFIASDDARQTRNGLQKTGQSNVKIKPQTSDGDVIPSEKAPVGKFESDNPLSVSGKRERMLAMVTARTTDAVIVTGPDYRILWVNEAFERLTGYGLSEVRGRIPGRVLQGEKTSKETTAYIRQRLRKRESVSVEILNYAKNGTEYWLDLNINPVFDETGALEFFIAVERNVTQKKEAEYALRTAMEQLEEVQSIAKIGYWELHYATGRIEMSEECYRIFGIDRASFKATARAMMGYIHPDDTAMLRNAINDALRTGSYDLVYRVLRSDGKVRYVQERGLLVEDPVHQEKILRGTVQDIDSSVRARMERETMQEIRQIIDSAPVAHFKLEMDEGGRIITKYMSESIRHIDARLDSESLRKSARPLMQVLGKAQYVHLIRQLTEAARSGKTLRLDLVVVREIGASHAEFVARPEVSDDAGLVWYGHVQDVTATFQRNLQLERLISMTNTQNERLLEFAQILSHNVRLHTSTIAGLITAIFDTGDPEEHHQYHGYLRQTSQELEQTLRDLNEVLMIRSQSGVNAETICLADWVEERRRAWVALIGSGGGRLCFQVRNPHHVTIHLASLDAIVEELLQNAVQFRSPDRALEVTLNIRSDRARNSLIISIADNGTGIDIQRNGKNLFGMYRTFHPGASGKGLGLFLARNRAEVLQGELYCESEINRGSVFTLELGLGTERP